MILARQLTRRNLASSSSSSSSSSSTISMPSQPTKSWERGAKLIKNTNVDNQYLEHMRDLHDPSLHLKTIEDELKGTIGKALGKQGEKILRYLTLMSEQKQIYNELIYELRGNEQEENQSQQQQQPQYHQSSTSDATALHETLNECITKHNEYRSMAIQARWELTVHRQAVGFIVNNHKFVHDKFPIGEKLQEYDVIGGEENDEGIVDNKKQQEKSKQQQPQKFGDQLDWWQKIGRWR